MNERDLGVLRRAFARQILAVAGVADDRRLERAFSRVPRERFLGRDPWLIARRDGVHVRVPRNDPFYVYQDVLFALAPSRGVNNGEPSLHARMLHALAPLPGQRVVHLGAGTGYYAAILAALVAPGGHVTAVEYDTDLAARASANLEDLEEVDVVEADGSTWPTEEVDRIYVTYGNGAPAAPWVERLAPGGRLVLPLGVPGEPERPGGPRFARQGGAFVVERRSAGFRAAHLCRAWFVHAEGAANEADPADVERLARAFASGQADFVRSLVWKAAADPARCWFWSPNWALSYDAA